MNRIRKLIGILFPLTNVSFILVTEHTIVTNAPETSKRAQYTKLEERKYVSDVEVDCLF
jgi:hypothetical protein